MRKILTVLLLLFTSLSLFGETKYLNLPFCTDISSLDPRVGSEAPTNIVIAMMYEGLMRYDEQGKVIPAIASSYEVSEDQLTYIFHLRDSVWSNGDPVTAYDFEYAWKKGVNPKTAERASYYYYPIKNAQACVEGKVSVDEVGVKALDEKTLIINLQYPASYIIESLASISNYMPIHKKTDQEHPKWATDWEKHLVTNGPFQLKKWQKDYEIVLAKNNHYWDSKNTKLQGINILIIKDINTAFNMFEKKKLDWLGEPFGGLLPDDLITPNEVQAKDTVAVELIWCNTEREPFNNKNFRKAIAYAINRKEIADCLYTARQKKPTLGLFQSDMKLSDTGYIEDGNEEKAKNFLNQALTELNLKSAPVLIYKQRSGATTAFSEYLQETLRKTLGLTVEIERQDFVTHFAKMRSRDFMFGELGWTSYAKDHSFFLTPFYKKDEPLNMTSWQDKSFQHFVDKALYEKNNEKRNLYLEMAEELLMEELPVIPLFQRNLVFKTNPNLKGFFLSPRFFVDFRHAYFIDQK